MRHQCSAAAEIPQVNKPGTGSTTSVIALGGALLGGRGILRARPDERVELMHVDRLREMEIEA
jgi:hypothetical protein